MRALKAITQAALYSVALCLIGPVYAAEEVPDSLKNVQLHKIQAAPDADLQLQSVSQLPLEKISAQHWRLPAGDYVGHFVIDQPITLECASGAGLGRVIP